MATNDVILLNNWVSQKGFVTIDSLARIFNVTVQTISRDLKQLDTEGRLIRYRGGAAPLSSVENIDYNYPPNYLF